jgi:hypothetical protein
MSPVRWRWSIVTVKMAMDAIRAQIGAMTREEESLREQGVRETTALVTSIISGLVGIALTIAVGTLIGRASTVRKRQEWFQAGQVGLETTMRGDLEPRELGDRILAFLTQYLGAIAGAMYIADGDGFVRTATFGLPAGANVPDRFGRKETLVGEAAAENRPLIINEVPDGYLVFGSAITSPCLASSSPATKVAAQPERHRRARRDGSLASGDSSGNS